MLERIEMDFDVYGLWYNPNIHPEQESYLRFDALEKFNALKGISSINIPAHSMEKWLDAAKASADRCKYCYINRLEETARRCFRGDKIFDCFSTTLLASPYQKHDLIRGIAETLSQKWNVEFIYVDVRKKYREAKEKIKKLGLYSQKYCGCIFSRQESDKGERGKRVEQKSSRD